VNDALESILKLLSIAILAILSNLPDLTGASAADKLFILDDMISMNLLIVSDFV
jgi:hypothetical protein